MITKLFKRNKWGSNQFYHRMTHTHGNVPRFTACVQIPQKKTLIKLVHNLAESKVGSVALKVGIACVNPKDTYNKKIGRELSNKRRTYYKFEIKSALSMNSIHQDPPEFKIKNDSFTNVELRAISEGKIIVLYFTINKLDKVVLKNVQLEVWPEYYQDGYKKKPIYSED